MVAVAVADHLEEVAEEHFQVEEEECWKLGEVVVGYPQIVAGEH
jgi:hypothetical protein